jgi:predicted small secreted protein
MRLTIRLLALALILAAALSVVACRTATGPGAQCERVDSIPMINQETGDTTWVRRTILIQGSCPAIIWWQTTASRREPED